MKTSNSEPVPQTRPLDVPHWLQRSAAWSWRLGIVFAAVLLFGWTLNRLRVVVIPILVAAMLASVLSPMVKRLQTRGLPRVLATWSVLIPTGLVLVAILGLVGWGLTSELTSESARWEQVGEDTRTWLSDGPLDLSEDEVDDLERRLRASLANGAGAVNMDRARLFIEVIGGALLAVALTFFFTKDGETMWLWLVRRIHPVRQKMVNDAGQAAIVTLRSYLKATGIAGVVDATVIGIGLWLLGVPLVIPLAIITFFAAFLPVLGATVAGMIAAIVALAFNGPASAIAVVVLTFVVQQVEGDVVLPVVMGRHVPLHPAVVLSALATGGAVAGIVGAFVAVPVAAMIAAALGAVRNQVGTPVEASGLTV